MRKIIPAGILIIIISLCCTTLAQAQFRDQETKRSEYSGPIIKKEDPSKGANLGNLFNMQMTHSYSMNFGTFGGQMMNMNAYTNSMQFFFTEDLTGQVDVSLLHSPFGQGTFNSFQDESPIQVALNAQLDYEINERMKIHFEVNRYPAGYGLYRGYGGGQRNPFLQTRPLFEY